MCTSKQQQVVYGGAQTYRPMGEPAEKPNAELSEAVATLQPPRAGEPPAPCAAPAPAGGGCARGAGEEEEEVVVACESLRWDAGGDAV